MPNDDRLLEQALSDWGYISPLAYGSLGDGSLGDGSVGQGYSFTRYIRDAIEASNRYEQQQAALTASDLYDVAMRLGMMGHNASSIVIRPETYQAILSAYQHARSRRHGDGKRSARRRAVTRAKGMVVPTVRARREGDRSLSKPTA